MMIIKISPANIREVTETLQLSIGGDITEKWGVTTLTVDNTIAKGEIRTLCFDWGVNLMIYQIKFFEEVVFKIEAKEYNPIHFIYNLKGEFSHRSGIQNQEKLIGQYQNLIFTNKTAGLNFLHFKKDIELDINVLQIVRKEFLGKRMTLVSTLNQKLQDIFVDTDYDNRFVHFGNLNLKMADHVKTLHNIKLKNMIKVLNMEAKTYEILSLHIQQYDKQSQGKPLPTSLDKSELKLIRKLGEFIIKNPSLDYNLEDLSAKSGVSQSKLQDGFKFLYTRTVTEYVRCVRLETARDLIHNTDLNISEVVYSIGFTSRSYFSKIFKEKYNITPNQFKKQVVSKVFVA
jgi:AraC-like DNA-binding protein